MTAEQLTTVADETEERTPLPEGWRLVRLGDVCELNPTRTSFALKLQDRPDDAPTSFVPMPAVDERLGVIARPEVKPFAQVKKGYTIFAEGDVLFAKITPCMQNGKHAIATDLIHGFGFGSTEFHVLRPNENVTSKWLHYFLRQPSVLKLATASFTGAVGQQRVPEKFLSDLEIPIPPTIEDQMRIATVLDEQMEAVEQARHAVEEQIEAAKLLPGALFFEAFHGITPLTIDPLEQDAPEGWRWETLRNLARLESGHTPSRYHPEWWGGDIPWLALPDIRSLDGKIAFETSEYTNELGIANSSARILPAGTVCLSRTATVGFVTVMGRPMATSQDFVNWVCGEQLDPYFLSFILQASRDYLLSLATGAVHKTIYVPTVKEFRICLPDLPEQKRIAERLTERMQAVENLKESLSAQLEAIDRMPAALLRKAFAGEV